MKKVAVLFLASLFFGACTSNNNGNLRITGEIKGLSQGKLYIQRVVDSVLKPIQVVSFDGKPTFETSLDIEEPEVLYFYLDRGVSNSLDNSIAFFADKGTITLHSDINSFIGKAHVKGNKNQDLLNDYRKVISGYNQKNLEFIEARIKAANNSVKIDSLMRLEQGVQTRKYQFTINFCLNHPEAEITPYLALSEIPDANPKYLDSIYNKLEPSVKQSKYGLLLSDYIKQLKTL